MIDIIKVALTGIKYTENNKTIMYTQIQAYIFCDIGKCGF